MMNPAASFSLTSAVGRFTAVVHCSSFVLSLNLAPTGDEHLRLYLLQSPLMISSSSLTHFKPRFFSPVDISAAVCEAQRVGSWPYKAMSALTRAGLMTLSPSWHYYHSQAQARDITPTNNNWKWEQKEKEWCLFLSQFQFAADFWMELPLSLYTQGTVTIHYSLCTVCYTLLYQSTGVL